VIESGAWRAFVFPDGEPDAEPFTWNAADFREFLQARRPSGCETPLPLVEKLVEGTDVEEAFREMTRGRPGAMPGERRNPAGVNQHTEERINRNMITDNPPADPPPRKRDYARESQQGNSASYTLRRLGRDRADLLEQVKAGELSPH
jgi:hypothetical protein